tara:strand:- start:92 stop:412 length:321 start_codon:yes stop_codon:yes gene_type:complete
MSEPETVNDSLKATIQAMQTSPLTKHHYSILERDLQRNNKDGTTTTVFASTFEFPDGVRMLPTFWDGKERSAEESVKRAKENWDEWPVYSSEKDANADYENIKKTW